MAWKKPSKTPAKPARDDEPPSFPGLNHAGPTNGNKTQYEELQQNELMVLESIYGEDFMNRTAAQGAWKKSEPSFDIRIKASTDEDIALTLGVVMTATYPKSPPLLNLKNHDNLKDSTLFKVQKFIETKPLVFAKEEQEMIDQIVEGIREILEAAADAKAKGLKLPSLEEERAAHEAALAKLAQDEREREERRKLEESKEEERVLGDMLQEELQRRKAKGKESRMKHRSGHAAPVQISDDATDEERERIVFDQPSRLEDTNGNAIYFNTVVGKSLFRTGPVSTTFIVKPLLSAGQARPNLMLKQAEVQCTSKDVAPFKKQLRSLEVQLELVKKLKHRNLLEILDFRIDRNSGEAEVSSHLSYTVNVLGTFADRGSLEEVFELAGHIDVGKVRSWSTDLLGALGFLHNNGVLHQSIHPGNILLVRETSGAIVPKLADAGFERELYGICTRINVTDTIRAAKSAFWFAPEIAGVSNPQYSQKTDIWDFGVLFLQMIFGMDVVEKYQGPTDLRQSLSLSTQLEELVSKFFKVEPKKRPRAFELSSSEFLATDAAVLEPDTSAIADDSVISQPPSFFHGSRRDSTNRRGFTNGRYRRDYVEESRLGKGGFGVVVKARSRLDDNDYAIKKITQSARTSLSGILPEVRLLSRINHPAVVKYYYTWLEEITEFSDNEADVSTEQSLTGGSEETISQDVDIQFTTSHGGLDFLSSSAAPQGFDDESASDAEDEDEDEENENPFGSNSEDESGMVGGPETETKSLSAGKQRTRRGSTRPYRSVLYICMEYCGERNLRNLITRGLYKDPQEAWRLFRQILEGLVNIHNLNIVHRDLKPENIFIKAGPDGIDMAKIGDFGLATTGTSQDKGLAGALDIGDMTRSVGTSVYVAPEVRSGVNGSYTSKVDMYALGVIFFEMSYPPMLGMERAVVLEKLRLPQPELPSDFKVTDKVQTEIIISLLNHNPKERPSSSELLKSGKLPVQMEKETVRHVIEDAMNPNSQYYEVMLTGLFSKHVDQAKDFAWDMSTISASSTDLARQQVVKDKLTAIFRRHGAVEATRHCLYPRSSHYSQSTVQLLDSSGNLLQLPFDLMMGNARALAKSTCSVAQKSYFFGQVFRDRHDGGPPHMFGEVDFDIATTDTLDLALKEAEVIKVLDEVLSSFPALSSSQMCFHLGHSNLLQVVFDHCRVEASSRRAAAEVLSKLNIRSFTWQKIRGELRSVVSPTSLDELSRFDFRDTPSKAFSKLKSIFEGTDNYQKASATLAHLKEVYEYCKRLSVTSKIYIHPLNSLNESFFTGGVLFSCIYDRKVKDVFAAGGRYDSLIKEHRPKMAGLQEERHAVGFSLAWERLAQAPRAGGKAFLKKAAAAEEDSIFHARRCDVLVASFDPAILRTTGLELLKTLWSQDISAELAGNARSPEDLASKHRDDNHSWHVIIKQDSIKVKTMGRKDTPDVDLSPSQVLSWLRSEIRDRDARAGIRSRGVNAPGQDTSSLGGGGASGSGAGLGGTRDWEQDVRVLVAQTKSKKFNRQAVVEQAQASATRLAESFLEGPIAAVETTDQVLGMMSTTALSEPESWRRLEQSVTTAEKNYVRDVHDMLTSWREEWEKGGSSGSGNSRHAFIYNFRTGTCVYYDLGA